ncbi:MAG TPA: MliC family protein [Candidatus Paceibacterota bacterium]|nr:MliC family protein [Candidatus Paceibacterota bacterium]
MKTSTAAIVVIVLLLLIGGGWWYYAGKAPATTTPPTTETPLATTAFACDAGKSIGATFYTGRADIVLSDGRTLSLPQTQSGSGIRYAATDESVIFWGKGNTAFVEEGADQRQTYTGCILVSPDPSNTLSQIYATSTLGFSLRTPAGYMPLAYTYQALGPNKGIKGVKFTIPATSATGTNLSKDTYISVEELPNSTTCLASEFLEPGAKAITFTDAGVDYSAATSSDAGAGNLYDEAVFSIPGTSPCIAVRYFIHSTQFANYPAGSVVEFSREAVINEFDAIRRSLVIGR